MKIYKNKYARIYFEDGLNEDKKIITILGILIDIDDAFVVINDGSNIFYINKKLVHKIKIVKD